MRPYPRDCRFIPGGADRRLLSSTEQLEVCSCKPTPGDLLPSSVQHRKLTFAFVRHNRPFLRKRGMPLRRPHRRDNVTLSPLEIVMRKVFHTSQFMAGNSPAVRIPVSMAFPKQTKLVVIREGNRLIVEPEEDSLESLPALFAALRPQHTGERPEFVETERSW